MLLRQKFGFVQEVVQQLRSFGCAVLCRKYFERLSSYVRIQINVVEAVLAVIACYMPLKVRNLGFRSIRIADARGVYELNEAVSEEKSGVGDGLAFAANSDSGALHGSP
jgi:hypothetical protein